MNAAEALGRLHKLGAPAFSTADAAALLGLSSAAASQTLHRLAVAGLVRPIRHALWTLRGPIEPLALVEYLTAPHPGYVSLQSALRLHGMIEQIPSAVYVVSLARSHRIRTTVGTFSVHRVAPQFFGGFDVLSPSGAKIATPEKALLDVFYLSGTRSRLFASLPELTLPKSFRLGYARRWIAKIPSQRLRTLVARRLESVLRGHGRRSGRPHRVRRAASG